MEKQTQDNQPSFTIQKIYTKDLSFEAPNAPGAFKAQWQPETKVNVDTKPISLSENVHEVELTLTITTKNDNNTAYLIEVTQAGIFTVGNLSEEQEASILGAFCPTTLFPYAKEVIDSLINKGGFPQINLQPINFDAIYMQKISQKSPETTQH